MECARCDRPMRSRNDPSPGFTRNTLGHRIANDGTLVHCQRGLCRTCATAATRDGTLRNYPTLPKCGRGRPTGHTIEDFHFLAETMGTRCRTNRFGYTRDSMRRIADRLRISVGALEKALDRERLTA